MEIKVVEVKNDDDFLDNLLTIEDLGEMMAQSIVDRIKKDPIEAANSLRKCNVINDKEYKEMVINIRKTQVEEDFK